MDHDLIALALAARVVLALNDPDNHCWLGHEQKGWSMSAIVRPTGVAVNQFGLWYESRTTPCELRMFVDVEQRSVTFTDPTDPEREARMAPWDQTVTTALEYVRDTLEDM